MYSFNPDTILVQSEQPLTLKLFPLMQVEPDLFEENKFLLKRWNAQFVPKKNDESNQLLQAQRQNKINLAILAFWLESDGHLPQNMYTSANQIVEDAEFRREYMNSIGEKGVLFKFVV